MSKLNTNTNSYTIIFLVVMVLIVGGALATVSSLAQPRIDKNVELDNKTKILSSVKFAGEGQAILDEYSSHIKAIAVNSKGDILEGVDGYNVELKKEYKKPLEERQLPVFIYTAGKEKKYIIPLIGLGLWDEVNGYIAFNSDLKTASGAAFDHVGETPGLGAVITEPKFEDQFTDAVVYNKDNEFVLKVYKQGKSPGTKSDIDGLAGATITTDGMDNMLRNCIPNYESYFNTLKK